MLRKRDAQQLSTTVIIVVVLGLVVLVVLLFIFGRETGKTANILENCNARGGECEAPGDCEGTRIPDICPDKSGNSQVCCVTL